MAVYMKELKINTPLSYFVVGKFFCKIQICLMAVYMKELKINTPLSYFVVGKFWAKSRSASWQLVKIQLFCRGDAALIPAMPDLPIKTNIKNEIK